VKTPMPYRTLSTEAAAGRRGRHGIRRRNSRRDHRRCPVRGPCTRTRQERSMRPLRIDQISRWCRLTIRVAPFGICSVSRDRAWATTVAIRSTVTASSPSARRSRLSSSGEVTNARGHGRTVTERICGRRQRSRSAAASAPVGSLYARSQPPATMASCNIAIVGWLANSSSTGRPAR
jgi:hypothetical protein